MDSFQNSSTLKSDKVNVELVNMTKALTINALQFFQLCLFFIAYFNEINIRKKIESVAMFPIGTEDTFSIIIKTITFRIHFSYQLLFFSKKNTEEKHFALKFVQYFGKRWLLHKLC